MERDASAWECSVDDNIYLSSDHRVSGQLFTIGGNFRLNWGLKQDDSFLALAYAPSLILFAGDTASDAFEQRGALSAQWRMTKLTLGATLSAQSLAGGDADVGDRAQRFLWQVALSANYDYSTKTSFQVTLAPNASDYSKYLDSIEWVNGNWIDYQLTPKTRVGAGVTLGYLKAQGGSAQTFQQALVRVSNPVTAQNRLPRQRRPGAPATRQRRRQADHARLPRRPGLRAHRPHAGLAGSLPPHLQLRLAGRPEFRRDRASP